MGTKSRQEMHSIVYAQAVENGPKKLIIGGKEYAAYTLKKKDLAGLFEMGGYSSDRITWLKAIRAYRDFYGDVAPPDSTLFDKGAEWSFVIGELYPEDRERLLDYARAYNLRVAGLESPIQYDLSDFGGEEA